MYISKVNIKNFRNFKKTEIDFNDGVNVIIGHNNSGKTNLIKALSLVIDYQGRKRLETEDFNKYISVSELKNDPPKISIAITITQGKSQEPDDLVTVSNWLTKLDEPYEALLTYEFFLPEKEKNNYLEAVSLISDKDEKALDKIWKIIQKDFIRLFVYKIWGGNVVNQAIADGESLQKFDFQFLDAIRDVERDMLTGRNTLLRDVLDFFMDYEIKSQPEIIKTKDEKKEEIRKKEKDFSNYADKLISELQKRMVEGKKQILSYAENTGASFNKAKPNFEGSLSEVEMFSALTLIIEHELGIKTPATHNGLGYNNLIFMSLLLAKMQVNSDGNYLGCNAKVFSTLAIEEPEAHLHPAMQYKFLKFLKENKDNKKVRQVFVSTHSTHITSAVSLDEIICLHNEKGATTVGYPGKLFPNEKNKKYVQRFLDATKSDMLFAQRVIFVEGIAEQLLISIFARYIGKSLEDNHIAVIDVGGRFFDHFLYLFDIDKSEFAINKKIACLTDRDPERKDKVNGKFNKCYPFEFNQDITKYDYRDNATDLIKKYEKHPNIRFFSQNEISGKTFEYDLVLHNPTLKLLITESMSNKEELQELMDTFEKNKFPVSDYINILRASDENIRVKTSLANADSSWTEVDKKKSIIATRYLNSVGKGENALELAYILEENLNKKGTSDYCNFEVPSYIKNAIEWICL